MTTRDHESAPFLGSGVDRRRASDRSPWRARLLFASLAALLLATVSAEEPASMSYTNPVVTPVAADPSLIRAPDGTFYLYATQDNWGGRDHYIPIFRSRDLVSWEYIHDAFVWPVAWKAGGGFLWAPDISFVDGEYRLYYAVSQWGDPNPCIGLATSEGPEGPWRDLGRPVFCSEDIGVLNSIDPFVHHFEEGSSVMVWGSFHGIYAVELSADGTAATGELTLLADTRFEAPYIIERDRYFYLFLSAGSCCAGIDSTYQTFVGRSDTLLGPYLDREGRDLRFGGGTLLLDANETWVGPGHNAVIQDDAGDDWIIYHAIPRADPRLPNGVARRPAMLDRITWEGGWPVVHEGSGPSRDSLTAPIIEVR